MEGPENKEICLPLELTATWERSAEHAMQTFNRYASPLHKEKNTTHVYPCKPESRCSSCSRSKDRYDCRDIALDWCSHISGGGVSVCLSQGQVVGEEKGVAIYVEAHEEGDQDNHDNM
jgi:hypothetical protein